MKGKELVKICGKSYNCVICAHGKVCEAYQRQFKCYPFEARKFSKYTPEVDNDTQIQFPDFII